MSQAPPEPTRLAWKDLELVLEPYLPLDRSPGSNVYHGNDLVKHSQRSKPLTKAGLLLTAVEKLEQWSAVVGPAYKERIENLQGLKKQFADGAGNSKVPEPSEKFCVKSAIRSTFPHGPKTDPTSQNPQSDKQANPKHVKLGGGVMFIQEAYVRKLEFENHLYRRHLDGFERLFSERVDNVLRVRMESLTGDSEAVKSGVNAARKVIAKTNADIRKMPIIARGLNVGQNIVSENDTLTPQSKNNPIIIDDDESTRAKPFYEKPNAAMTSHHGLLSNHGLPSNRIFSSNIILPSNHGPPSNTVLPGNHSHLPSSHGLPSYHIPSSNTILPSNHGHLPSNHVLLSNNILSTNSVPFWIGLPYKRPTTIPDNSNQKAYGGEGKDKAGKDGHEQGEEIEQLDHDATEDELDPDATEDEMEVDKCKIEIEGLQEEFENQDEETGSEDNSEYDDNDKRDSACLSRMGAFERFAKGGEDVNVKRSAGDGGTGTGVGLKRKAEDDDAGTGMEEDHIYGGTDMVAKKRADRRPRF